MTKFEVGIIFLVVLIVVGGISYGLGHDSWHHIELTNQDGWISFHFDKETFGYAVAENQTLSLDIKSFESINVEPKYIPHYFSCSVRGYCGNWHQLTARWDNSILNMSCDNFTITHGLYKYPIMGADRLRRDK